MRFFRIPNFSGIEAHRDDADRGSLRVVEGCFPVSTGGISSGPVWEDLATVDETLVSQTKENHVTVKEDENLNSFMMASRKGSIHDLHVMTEPRTVIGNLQEDRLVYFSNGDLNQKKVYFNSIGNRTLMIGEGSSDPISVGKGPPSQQGEEMSVAPDYAMYGQEWKVFKRCKYFLVGPNKCIFAAGNCLDPLAVYVSEPAGLSTPNRDSPYSNEAISRVNILMSNATLITGLSLKGTQVIVHTDAGCHLLYSTKTTQASTGYRVEQRPTSVSSAAASNASVNRGHGTSPLWLGQDGHIYKDESASVGQEDQDKNTDRDQATYKSKGAFEHELPEDLSDSFATYDASSGTYFAYVKSKEYVAWQEAHGETPEKDDDFICPADEDDSESDPQLIPEPTAVAKPVPIVVQPPENPSIPEEPEPVFDCGDAVAVVSGGVAPSTREHLLGSDEGEVSLDLQTFVVPDKMEVIWDGKTVIDTGFVSFAKKGDPIFDEDLDTAYLEAIEETSEGKWWKPINGEEVKSLNIGDRFKFIKDKATPQTAEVKVTPCPIGNTTKWEYVLQCPKPVATTECQAWFAGHIRDAEVVENLPNYKPIKLFQEDNSPKIHARDTDSVALIGAGEYPSAETLLKDPIDITLDIIAAPKGVRVRLYEGNNYGSLVFDETGPFIYFNSFGAESNEHDKFKYVEHLKEHHTQEELDLWGIDIDRDFNITKYNMLHWGFRSKNPADKILGNPPFNGVSLKIDCPKKEVVTPQDCFDDAEFIEDLPGINLGRGAIAVGYYMITPKFLTCLCNAYGKEEHLDDLLWTYEKLKEANVAQTVVITHDGSAGGANASYAMGSWGPFAAEGVVMMRMHTITGLPGGEEPMDQFLESYRHEGVHAAQDLEHNFEVAFGQSTNHLLPVADEGVIWNQHGVSEIAAYERGDMTLEEYQLLLKLELEANSAEISQKLTELAWELVGERDKP